MKSVRPKTKAKQPQHFDLGFWIAQQERSHQSGDSPRGAQRGDDAARTRPSVELKGHGPGNKIEDRINDTPPGIFQNGARKPQKPHIADDVQPAAVQKIRGDIRNWLRVRGNKRVTLENRVVLKLRVSLRQRIHLSL